MEFQTLALILMKFCKHIPRLSKKGFKAGLTPLPHLGLGGLKPFKLKDTLLKAVHKTKMFSRLQINPCSAGYLSYTRLNMLVSERG